MAAWNKVEQSDIAEAIRDVAKYLQSKNIGDKSNLLFKEWLGKDGLANQIDQMDQNALDFLFGENDPQDYWPGKFRPTLIDMNKALRFFAYREHLEGQKPNAQALINKVNAFDGFGGSCHAAGTKYNHEIGRYIAATARHPSENYIAPDEPTIDMRNSINYAFDWLANSWLPLDTKTMRARLEIGDNPSSTSHKKLAYYKATIEEGFRRGNMNVDVTIEFGKTYGETAVVIRASMDEYQKFVEIKRGQRSPDLSPTEELRPWGDIPGPHTSGTFIGFELDKAAFYGPGGTYVSVDAIEQAETNITDKVDWLRQSNFVSEEEISIASSSGETKYVRFSRQDTPHNQEPLIIGQRYWSSTDLHNEINSKLWEISDILNGGTGKNPNRIQRSKLASEWFEHAGKIYVQTNVAAFQQAAFHFKATHGLKYSQVHPACSSDELKALTGNGWWNALHIDEIPASERAGIHKKVVKTLNEVKTDIENGNTGMKLPSIAPA